MALEHLVVRTVLRADPAAAVQLAAAGVTTMHEAQGRSGLREAAEQAAVAHVDQ
jgi:hypothetical protein